MTTKRLESKVGLFVFIGLVLVAALMLQFTKGTSFWKPTYRILMRSSNVAGLKPKASVLMSGVEVGTVSDIALANDGTHATVTLKLYSRYKVHKDARFVLQQSGFLGDQYVGIITTENKGDLFKDGDMVEAETPFNFQEVARSASGVVQRIETLSKQLNDTVSEVRKSLLNEHTLTNLSMTAANLKGVSERAMVTLNGVESLVSTNTPAISAASSNLAVFSEQLNEFAASLKGVVETNRVGVEASVKNIESSTEMLKRMLEDVQAGKGLAGTVLRNDRIGADLSNVAHNLSITSSNLNRLGLWGILWKKKMPRESAPAEIPLESPKAKSQ